MVLQVKKIGRWGYLRDTGWCREIVETLLDG